MSERPLRTPLVCLVAYMLFFHKREHGLFIEQATAKPVGL
jgi:hypothetical protein